MHPSKKYLHSPNSNSNAGKKSKVYRNANGPKSNLSRRPPNKQRSTRTKTKPKTSRDRHTNYASMLPPPLKSPSDYGDEEDEEYNSNRIETDPTGLSSWEQFLGTKPRPESTATDSKPSTQPQDDEVSQKPPSMAKLPSIQDLFPPDLSLAPPKGGNGNAGGTARGQRQQERQRTNNKDEKANETQTQSSSNETANEKQQEQQQQQSETSTPNASQHKQQQQQQQPLEGVLPVSDLFYRSSQSIDAVDDRMEGDDEELPFSAEQTDQLAVDHNKVKVRRNQAALETLVSSTTNIQKSTNKTAANTNSNNQNKRGSSQQSKSGSRRKMVRRGMEMLVGGVPINADPPQRSMALFHYFPTSEDAPDWYNTISVNMRDFGPFFSDSCQHQLTRNELALFCEFWTHSTMKWDVCPKELRAIVAEYYKQNEATETATSTNTATQSDARLQQQEQESSRAPSKFKLPSATRSLTVNQKRDKLRPLREVTDRSILQDDSDSNEDEEEEIQKMKETVENMKEVIRCLDESTRLGLEMEIGILEDDEDEFPPPKQVSPKGFGKPQRKQKKKLSAKDREAEKLKEALQTMKEAVKKMEENLNQQIVSNNKDSSADKKTTTAKGFGKPGKKRKTRMMSSSPKPSSIVQQATDEEYIDVIEGQLEVDFDLALSKDDLESTGEQEGSRRTILEKVFEKGMRICLEKELPDPLELFGMRDVNRPTLENDFQKEALILDDLIVKELHLNELDDGTTEIKIVYVLTVAPIFINEEKAKHKLSRIFDKVIDSGEMCLAMASVVQEEERWPQDFRERMYEDFLFEDDDEDKTIWEGENGEEEGGDKNKEDATKVEVVETEAKDGATNATATAVQGEVASATTSTTESSSPAVNGVIENNSGNSNNNNNNETIQEPQPRDSRFLRGGPDGVFWDYSEANAANAPFQGKLGHKLLEHVEKRFKENPPKVIAVGDVHGCIDELQDLLRQCDYSPGDLIVFLGDLVSKGPDSISVVQMSREIGAIGVRGNHDFEVIRWHQAIKSGVDPPVVGSEHYHVASCLSKADVKWLYSLPWYITSKELGALFVHAGFVSGIRLAKQNPRLMMNMRSILPDGTVTSKFFNNWPWARLWDGPQTVYFGHDADRGLQQYEHAIGLDTGCVYGGRLTACILPEKRLVSVSARREYFKYRRKHYD